jgi:hypothetical protein
MPFEGSHMESEERPGAPPEDQPGEPGAEGGSSGSADAPTPASPQEDDDSPLGDTDQHSDANA